MPTTSRAIPKNRGGIRPVGSSSGRARALESTNWRKTAAAPSSAKSDESQRLGTVDGPTSQDNRMLRFYIPQTRMTRSSTTTETAVGSASSIRLSNSSGTDYSADEDVMPVVLKSMRLRGDEDRDTSEPGRRRFVVNIVVPRTPKIGAGISRAIDIRSGAVDQSSRPIKAQLRRVNYKSMPLINSTSEQEARFQSLLSRLQSTSHSRTESQGGSEASILGTTHRTNQSLNPHAPAFHSHTTRSASSLPTDASPRKLSRPFINTLFPASSTGLSERHYVMPPPEFPASFHPLDATGQRQPLQPSRFGPISSGCVYDPMLHGLGQAAVPLSNADNAYLAHTLALRQPMTTRPPGLGPSVFPVQSSMQSPVAPVGVASGVSSGMPLPPWANLVMPPFPTLMHQGLGSAANIPGFHATGAMAEVPSPALGLTAFNTFPPSAASQHQPTAPIAPPVLPLLFNGVSAPAVNGFGPMGPSLFSHGGPAGFGAPPAHPCPPFRVTQKPRDHDPVKQQEYEAYLEWRKANEPGYHMACKVRQANRVIRQYQDQHGGSDGAAWKLIVEKAKAAVGAIAAEVAAKKKAAENAVKDELKAKVGSVGQNRKQDEVAAAEVTHSR